MDFYEDKPKTLREKLKTFLGKAGIYIAGIFIIYVGYLIYSFEYETQKLVNYKPQLTTEVYDREGHKIANLFTEEHRYYTSYENIPPMMIEALLAIEDTSFFEHHGVNPDAILRAIVKDVTAGKLKEGASTITQQLVKNTLLSREKSFSRKFKEVLYSFRIEQELTKSEILERYFNEIYLGHGYYGIKTASDGYFRKPLKDLTLKECAMLVGLPKAPNVYAPTKNYELSLGRANRILNRLLELGWIDQETYNKASQERPKVYNDTLTQNSGPYVIDEVMRELSASYPDIRTGGYKVYTTIDMRLQEAGYKALQSGRNEILKRAELAGDLDDNKRTQLNGALMSMDSYSGEILAMVGGYDYNISSFNRVTQAKRQTGSAFKPFVYQVALNSGLTPDSTLQDAPRNFTYTDDKGQTHTWSPRNDKNNSRGPVPMRTALSNSLNLATVNMVADLGFRNVVTGLRQLGFTGNIPPDLTVALGTMSFSPYEMARYFSIFSTEGYLTNPILVREIVTPTGEKIRFQNTRRHVVSPEKARQMRGMLQGVVGWGTGAPARVKGMDIAGKTGTTSKNVDAWFVGFSPSVQTVVWFGHDNNTPMRRSETGGRAAGPTFRYFYEDLLRIYPNTKRYFNGQAKAVADETTDDTQGGENALSNIFDSTESADSVINKATDKILP